MTDAIVFCKAILQLSTRSGLKVSILTGFTEKQDQIYRDTILQLL